MIDTITNHRSNVDGKFRCKFKVHGSKTIVKRYTISDSAASYWKGRNHLMMAYVSSACHSAFPDRHKVPSHAAFMTPTVENEALTMVDAFGSSFTSHLTGYIFKGDIAMRSFSKELTNGFWRGHSVLNREDYPQLYSSGHFVYLISRESGVWNSVSDHFDVRCRWNNMTFEGCSLGDSMLVESMYYGDDRLRFKGTRFKSKTTVVVQAGPNARDIRQDIIRVFNEDRQSVSQQIENQKDSGRFPVFNHI